MRKLVCLLALFLISCSCAHAPKGKTISIKEKIHSVVRVFALPANPLTDHQTLTASGFAISEDEIMTAGHFCEAYQDGVNQEKLMRGVLIQYYNQYDIVRIKDNAAIQYFEFTPKKDVCVLTLKKHGVPPVVIEDEKVEVGDRVYAIGAPNGMLPIVTEGFVSVAYSDGYSRKIFDNKMILSVAGFGGMSGCPIFNENGKVVGMLVMVDEEFHHTSWAVPAEILKENINVP